MSRISQHIMNTLQSAFFISVFVTMCGCSRPVYNDSSGLTITPGVGISNIVEIGMSRSAIINATRDLVPTSSQNKDRYYIPSLGLVVFLDADGIVYKIDAVVDLSRHHETSPTRILTPFCGKLSGLSFHKSHVNRAAVVRLLGYPSYFTNYDKQMPREERERTIKCTNRILAKGQSVSIQEGDTEALCYPQNGISVDLDNDRISNVRVLQTNSIIWRSGWM